MRERDPSALSRREFGARLGLAAAGTWASQSSAFARAPGIRVAGPEITHGVASGDVGEGSAVIWSRADRPSRMVVEYATTDRFQDARTVVGPIAGPESDFAAKIRLTGLPEGQTIAYRVHFRDVDKPTDAGASVTGHFRTPSRDPANVRFVWGGDVAGQGWGIDEARGGMQTFASMLAHEPDFFLHSGDHIYADNPIPAEVPLSDGTVWKNLVTPATSKVAETLDEFRGRYRYNLLDTHFRKFAAEVPILAQWDDHEVLNNWYPGEVLGPDARYVEKNVDLLVARARRAFFEHLPIAAPTEDAERVYRKVSYGPLLDVFVLDQRSYRGPNTSNDQDASSPTTAFLGATQLSWLKQSLAASKATWKVIASDMPIGLVIGDGPRQFEGIANANGLAKGRELEIADLLAHLKRTLIANVVWFTADVHYAAAHHYDPSRARFTDFLPFWEFVAGPLHAGTFGPGVLDDTFGPEVKFTSRPRGARANLPPSDGEQFFGQVQIDSASRVMTVSLHDRRGASINSRELTPE